MSNSIKPTQSSVRKDRSFLKIAANLAPLSNEAIAEFRSIKEKRDGFVVQVEQTKSLIRQLEMELDAETDHEKKSALKKKIHIQTMELSTLRILARAEEQYYGALLSKHQWDSRLFYLVRRNQWPDTPVNLPSPEQIEVMRQKKVKLAQRSLEALEQQ